jgi:hypothetical protein
MRSYSIRRLIATKIGTPCCCPAMVCSGSDLPEFLGKDDDKQQDSPGQIG